MVRPIVDSRGNVISGEQVAERTRGRDRDDAPEDFAFIEGYTLGQQFDRTVAFGAIRRAVTVARECEAKGWEQTTISLQWAWWNKAHEIRRAIRAAIGSEKANA